MEKPSTQIARLAFEFDPWWGLTYKKYHNILDNRPLRFSNFRNF